MVAVSVQAPVWHALADAAVEAALLETHPRTITEMAFGFVPGLSWFHWRGGGSNPPLLRWNKDIIRMALPRAVSPEMPTEGKKERYIVVMSYECDVIVSVYCTVNVFAKY